MRSYCGIEGGIEVEYAKCHKEQHTTAKSAELSARRRGSPNEVIWQERGRDEMQKRRRNAVCAITAFL